MTIWDYYPDILNEEGNFNGYTPESDSPERNTLAERADEDGNIVVVEEYGEQEQLRLLKLRFERVNTIRKAKGLPELTEAEFLAYCRPNQITDEAVCMLSRGNSKIYNEEN